MSKARPAKSIDAHKILVMLRLTNDAIYRIRQQELKKAGLTPEQAIALLNIHFLGERATAAELARYSFRERASMAEILARLEKNGLITRAPDKKRRNIIKISLTPQGEKAHGEALKITSIKSIVNTLSEEEREQLWSLLDKLKDQALKKLKIDLKTFSRFFKELSDLG
jgi:DNA-binding MarR family transcriptional regulator